MRGNDAKPVRLWLSAGDIYVQGILMKKKFSMKRGANRVFLGRVAFVAVAGIAAVASAQTRTLRIVEYNIQDDTSVETAQGTISVISPLNGLITPYNGTNTGTSWST